MIKRLSDEDIEATIMSQDRINSIHTDEAMTCLGSYLVSRYVARIQAKITARKAEQEILRQVYDDLTILAGDITLKNGSKVGALFAAQTRHYRQELKKLAEGK